MADYSLIYYTATGAKIVPLIFSSLRFIRSENQIGTLTVNFPASYYPPGFFRPDFIIEVVKKSYSGNTLISKRDGSTFWLVRRVQYQIDDSGVETLEVVAYDAISILNRRIVAYDKGNDYTDKIDFADDLIKEIVRENFSYAALDSSRDLLSWLVIDANSSSGAIVFQEISRKNVFQAISDIARASGNEGTKIIFDLVCEDAIPYLRLKTWAGQRGNDHSSGSASPISVGFEYGNLIKPLLVLNFIDEKNYIYAGGDGAEDLRIVEEEYDAARIAWGPFARTELWVDAGSNGSSDVVKDVAKAYLYSGKPRLLFTGQMIDNQYFAYGIHYSYGDLVTAQYKGYSLNCRIATVTVSYDSENGEKVEARLEGETFI